VADFFVEMKKDSTVRYVLVAGAPDQLEAMRIARRYSASFGVPMSAKSAADHLEPEPPISFYIPRY
jgi:hypothetical protein